MSQQLKAIYHDGVFVPQAPCDLPEEAEVELIVQSPQLVPPKVTDPDARTQAIGSPCRADAAKSNFCNSSSFNARSFT